ncbi:hypothetical protein FOL47_004510, partial [Perkinsus chesapeaki]
MSEPIPAGSLPNLSDLWGPLPVHEEEIKHEGIEEEEEPHVELGSLDSLFADKSNEPTLNLSEVEDTKEVKLPTPREEHETQPTVGTSNDEVVEPVTCVVESSPATVVQEDLQAQSPTVEDSPSGPIRTSPKSSSSR